MKVTWNGTGSAWSPGLGNSSAVLEAGDHRLLMDCGYTVPARLKQMGYSLRDMDAVFISHLHGDHVYGLEEWGFRNRLIWGIKPPLLIAADLATPLWKHVLSGTMAQVCDYACLLQDYFTVIPLSPGEPHQIGPWTVEIHPVRHVPHAASYGLRVRADGATVGFTCDTLADADPWFYEDAEAVFHDCTFCPVADDTVHTHFAQLCDYPEAFRRRTYAVHYTDDVAELAQDPAWCAMLERSGMRLTEARQPYVFERDR